MSRMICFCFPIKSNKQTGGLFEGDEKYTGQPDLLRGPCGEHTRAGGRSGRPDDRIYPCLPSRVIPDWDGGTLTWIPLCRHDSDWLGQDAHPHPIYAHSGKKIFFNSRSGRYVKVYAAEV